MRIGAHYYLAEQPCELCGTPFRPRADASPGRGRFCGRTCANKYRRSLRLPWGEDGHKFVDRYVMVRMSSHPAAKATGYVYEHRLVMEQQLGRYLKPSEHVHHINGDRTDNRIENLELMTAPEHLLEHRPSFEETRKQRARDAARKFQKRIVLSCSYCGKPIVRRPSELAPTRNAYCNRQCYFAGKTRPKS